MKALNVFKLNIFNIFCFMYKCKQNLNSPVFRNIFTDRAKTKYALRNEYFIQEPMPNEFLSVLHFIPWNLPLEQNSNFKKFNLW